MSSKFEKNGGGNPQTRQQNIRSPEAQKRTKERTTRAPDDSLLIREDLRVDYLDPAI